jgi:hypothetical protein
VSRTAHRRLHSTALHHSRPRATRALTTNNPLACSNAVIRRNSVTTVADRTNRSVRNFSTMFVLLGSTPATKKVCLHIQKVELRFAIQTAPSTDTHMQIHFRCSGQSVFRELTAASNSGTRSAQIAGRRCSSTRTQPRASTADIPQCVSSSQQHPETHSCSTQP